MFESICHIHRLIWWVSKIGSGALVSQIPKMHYQKALTGVFVGVVYQGLKCYFIGYCFQTLKTRFILLHNGTSQEHKTRPTGGLGAFYYVVNSWNSNHNNYSANYSKCHRPARMTDFELIISLPKVQLFQTCDCCHNYYFCSLSEFFNIVAEQVDQLIISD